MDNLFKTLAEEYSNKSVRLIILTLLFRSNIKLQQFAADMLVIVAATMGKMVNPQGLPDLYTSVLCNMANNPQGYHNVYNDYLVRGRIAIMEDYIAEEKNKRKTG